MIVVFASAVGSEHAEAAPARDRKADAAHDLAAVVALDEPLDFYHASSAMSAFLPHTVSMLDII